MRTTGKKTISISVAILSIVVLTVFAVMHMGGGTVQANSKDINNLQAVSNASDELEISWDVPTITPKDYRVTWRRSDLEVLSYREPNETQRGNHYPRTNSLVLNGLESGEDYNIIVRARYKNGSQGSWSNEITATVSSDSKSNIVPKQDLDYSPENVTVEPTANKIKVYWDANSTNAPSFYIVTIVKESESHYPNSSFVNRASGRCAYSFSGAYATKEHLAANATSSLIKVSPGTYDFAASFPVCSSASSARDKLENGIDFKVKIIGRDGDGTNASHFNDFVEVNNIRTKNHHLQITRVVLGNGTLNTSWNEAHEADHIVFEFKSGSLDYPTVPDSPSVGAQSNTSNSSGENTSGYRILAPDTTSIFIDNMVPGIAYTARVYPAKAGYIYPKSQKTGRPIKIIPSANGRRMQIQWNAIDSTNIPDKFLVHYGSWGFYYNQDNFVAEAGRTGGDGLEQDSGHRRGFRILTPADVMSSSSYGYETWLPLDDNTSSQLGNGRLFNHIYICEINGSGTSKSHYTCDDGISRSRESSPEGVWAKPHGITINAIHHPSKQIKATWPAVTERFKNIIFVYKSGSHSYPDIPATFTPLTGDTVVGGKNVAGYRILDGSSSGYQLNESNIDESATYTVKLIPRATSEQVIGLPHSDEVEIDLSEPPAYAPTDLAVSPTGDKFTLYWNASNATLLPDHYVVHYGIHAIYFGLDNIVTYLREGTTEQVARQNGKVVAGFKVYSRTSVASSHADYAYEQQIPHQDAFLNDRSYYIGVYGVDGGTAGLQNAANYHRAGIHTGEQGSASADNLVPSPQLLAIGEVSSFQYPEEDINITWTGAGGIDNIAVVYKSGSQSYPTVPSDLTPNTASTVVGGKDVAGYRIVETGQGTVNKYTLSGDFDGSIAYTFKLIPYSDVSGIIGLAETSEQTVDLSSDFEFKPTDVFAFPTAEGEITYYWNANDAPADEYIFEYKHQGVFHSTTSIARHYAGGGADNGGTTGTRAYVRIATPTASTRAGYDYEHTLTGLDSTKVYAARIFGVQVNPKHTSHFSEPAVFPTLTTGGIAPRDFSLNPIAIRSEIDTIDVTHSGFGVSLVSKYIIEYKSGTHAFPDVPLSTLSCTDTSNTISDSTTDSNSEIVSGYLVSCNAGDTENQATFNTLAPGEYDFRISFVFPGGTPYPTQDFVGPAHYVAKKGDRFHGRGFTHEFTNISLDGLSGRPAASGITMLQTGRAIVCGYMDDIEDCKQARRNYEFADYDNNPALGTVYVDEGAPKAQWMSLLVFPREAATTATHSLKVWAGGGDTFGHYVHLHFGKNDDHAADLSYGDRDYLVWRASDPVWTFTGTGTNPTMTESSWYPGSFEANCVSEGSFTVTATVTIDGNSYASPVSTGQICVPD